MTQRVVLGGQIWHGFAPDGDELILTTRTRFRATGAIVRDARWGDVRVFDEIEAEETLESAEKEKP